VPPLPDSATPHPPDEGTIAISVDCRGAICPLPIIKLSAALKSVSVGAIVELFATDPGTVADLEAYRRRSGHRVLAHSEADGVLRFLVQRAT
jgi:tRNA 2-thiouridine synthesizing protein A